MFGANANVANVARGQRANVAEVILPECSQLISAIVAEVILPLCNPELPLPLRNWHGFESPK